MSPDLPRSPDESTAPGAPTERTGSRPSPDRLLASYLHDHWLAAHAELRLAHRAATGAMDDAARRELGALARQAGEDRAALLGLLDAVGVDRPRGAERVVAAAERVGRLKPNGTLRRRSPVSDLVEVEAWLEAVQLRRLGWTALRELAEVDHRLDPYQLDLLIRRAEDQAAALEHLHVVTARRALAETTSVAASAVSGGATGSPSGAPG
jgi:hypothetical protein